MIKGCRVVSSTPCMPSNNNNNTIIVFSIKHEGVKIIKIEVNSPSGLAVTWARSRIASDINVIQRIQFISCNEMKKKKISSQPKFK